MKDKPIIHRYFGGTIGSGKPYNWSDFERDLIVRGTAMYSEKVITDENGNSTLERTPRPFVALDLAEDG
jgi:hypothetical protein